jgi:hypothetical protein
MKPSAARARTRPIHALARVVRAPIFVLALWLAQMLFAKLLAAPTRAAAKAGLGGGAWFEDGHRLRALVELFVVEPAIIGTIVAALSTSAILAALFSVIAAPAILTRLDGERSTAAVLGASAKLPAIVVQTGYGLVVRAIFTGLAVIPATTLGIAGAPIVLILASFPVLVLDRARAAVTLDGARPYHPMTILRAIVEVGKRPLVWLTGAAIEALRLGVAIGALLLILQADVGGSIWIARLAGLVAIVLGLWRIALTLEARTRVEPS